MSERRPERVLVIDGPQRYGARLAMLLRQAGYTVRVVGTARPLSSGVWADLVMIDAQARRALTLERSFVAPAMRFVRPDGRPIDDGRWVLPDGAQALGMVIDGVYRLAHEVTSRGADSLAGSIGDGSISGISSRPRRARRDSLAPSAPPASWPRPGGAPAGGARGLAARSGATRASGPHRSRGRAQALPRITRKPLPEPSA